MAKRTNDPLDTISGIANTGSAGIVTELEKRPQIQTWDAVSNSLSTPPPVITEQQPQGTTPFARSTQVASVNAPTWPPQSPTPVGPLTPPAPLRSAAPPAPVFTQRKGPWNRTPDTIQVGPFGTPRQEVPEPSIDIDSKSIGTTGPIARIAGQQFNTKGQARYVVHEATEPMGIEEATAKGIIYDPGEAQLKADNYAKAFRGGGMSTQMVSDAAGRLGSDMNLGMREIAQNSVVPYRRIDPNSVQAQKLNAEWEDAREAALKGSMSDQAWTKRESDRNAQLMRRVQEEGATPQALAQKRQIAGAADVESAKSVVEAEKSARDAMIARSTREEQQSHQERLAAAAVYAQQAKQGEELLNSAQGVYLHETEKAKIKEDIRVNMEKAKRANPALDVGDVKLGPAQYQPPPETTITPQELAIKEKAKKRFPKDIEKQKAFFREESLKQKQ